MSTAYLGLGSNLGDRESTLAGAVQALASAAGIEVRKRSSVYETAPVGLATQPDFLNLVVEIGTSLAPRELLSRCLEIETSFGRVRREHWGPRTLDIDVLWFDGLTWADSELILPHPRMQDRGFVLTPLAEIAPDLELDGGRASLLASQLGNDGIKSLGPLKLGF